MALKKPTLPKPDAEAPPHADLDALTAALASPESGERRRAARELGAFRRPGRCCARISAASPPPASAP
ncbi:hypothetical protein [Methylobacterium sp. WL1]|uniref:hypothetical protein n=1 Tax=Methylobacterium sp. WL1 TaxID=2603276 RepID=UPI001AEEEB05|nr:hypothetical protein [Methylobacterium sp. WL1]